jgi:hypothetical protein
MEQNKENSGGELEKIALICDGLQQLFPSGKHAVIFELETEDYKKIQTNFRDIDKMYKRFQIDLSGVECVFIDKNLYDELDEENKKREETLKKENDKKIEDDKKSKFWNRFKKLFA